MCFLIERDCKLGMATGLPLFATTYFLKNNIASSLSYNCLFDSYIISPIFSYPLRHVCYTYDEIFKINLECCLKLDYTISLPCS